MKIHHGHGIIKLYFVSHKWTDNVQKTVLLQGF